MDEIEKISQEIMYQQTKLFSRIKKAQKYSFNQEITNLLKSIESSSLCIQDLTNQQEEIYLKNINLSNKNNIKKKINSDSHLSTPLVMVVDDEEMVLKVTCIIIAKMGYRPLSFSSSIEALEYYTIHNKEIDLVLLDMIMPQMNGKQLFLAMKEINPQVKTILLSGWIDDEENNDIHEIGLDRFLHKPIEKALLEKNILEILNKK